MNRTSSATAQFRKSYTNEENFDSNSNSVFVPPTTLKENVKDGGLEYRLDVTNDAEYISKIFETNSYDHNYETLLDYYSEICYIMDSKELGDPRNFGAVMGMAALGAFGVITLSVSFVGGVAGVIFGGTIGRVIANKISDARLKRNEKTTQEDLFRLKLHGMLQLAKIHKKQSKNNLNNYRLTLEKILEESSPALENSIFNNQKAMNDVRVQLRRVFLDPSVQKAILLSYKLFKAFMEQNDMTKPKNLQNAARKLNAVFVPYTRFIELDQKILHQTDSDPSLSTYYKIKALLAEPEIIDTIDKFPEYKMTPEALEKLRKFLWQEVNRADPIRQAIARSNRPGTMTDNQLQENPRKFHANTEDNIINAVSPKLDASFHNNSSQSLKDFQLNDIAEGVNVCKTEVYNVDLSRIKSLCRNDSYSRTQMGPRMAGAKLGDLSWNEQSDNEGTRKQDRNDPDKDNLGQKQHFLTTGHSLYETKELKMIRFDSQNQPEKSQPSSIVKEKHLDLSIPPLKKENSEQNDSQITIKNKEGSSPTMKPLLQSGPTVNTGPSATNKVIFDRVLNIAYDEVTKWDKVCNNPTIRIEKVRPEGSPVVLIRAWAFIDGYSPKEVFDQIFDSEKRGKWDTVTVGLNVVEKIDENTQIIHFIIKAPMGVSDRDFVQKRNYQMDYPEKGTITMSFQSFAHPKMPPHKNRIRGETHIAGYVIKPSTRAPNSTDLCILTQVDIKGSIPKIIVNMVAGKAPAEWVNKLVKACERCRQENQKAGK